MANPEFRAETPYWSKAVGEPPLVLAISVHQALIETVAACGMYRPKLDAPATPERVLLATVDAWSMGRGLDYSFDPTAAVASMMTVANRIAAASLSLVAAFLRRGGAVLSGLPMMSGGARTGWLAEDAVGSELVSIGSFPEGITGQNTGKNRKIGAKMTQCHQQTPIP
jgi:hypothetical protein